MDSKKIVEVFIETDEEEDSYSSSSSSDEEEAPNTEGPSSPPQQASGAPPEGLAPFPELDGSLSSIEMSEQAGFDLYDREEAIGEGNMDVDIEALSSGGSSRSHSPLGDVSGGQRVKVSSSLSLRKGDSRDAEVNSGSSSPVSIGEMGGFARIFGEEEVGSLKASLSRQKGGGSSASQYLRAQTTSDTSKERQAASSDPNQLYCICRQPALHYFMIQCNKCQDWFHGECVGINRQKAAKIKEFYCPLCIDKDPNLVTVFQTRAEEDAVVKEKHQRRQVPTAASKKARKHSRRCGECVACLTETDCCKCRFCRDMPKYGGPGRMRQKCIKRQCLRYSRILYAEDPLHSKKKVLQEDIAAELRRVGGDVSSYEAMSVGSRQTGTEGSAQLESKPPAEREPAISMETQPETSKLSSFPKPKPPPKKKPLKRLGQKQQKAAPKAMLRKKKGRTRLSTSDLEIVPSSGRRSRKPFSDLLGGLYGREEVHTPQQCQGPGCVFAARPHSKYCDEECGIQLAMSRIRTLLPERKQQWDQEEEAIATTINREKLQELEEEQKKIKSRLEELDQQTQAIDTHMTQLMDVTPLQEDESSETESDDLTIYCATCSQPVGLKKAMVHIERCFVKLEGMVSFGSIVKNEETNIFCDKYDPSQKTYCKRLRVLCPEHNKEPKIGPNEVCGCPLDPTFPSEKRECSQFCKHPKRSCMKHYCWEKLKRAEIDQEKLNLYLKLEEVNEQSRLLQWQIEHRGSLLAVMLHHTIDHDKEEQRTEASGDSEIVDT